MRTHNLYGLLQAVALSLPVGQQHADGEAWTLELTDLLALAVQGSLIGFDATVIAAVLAPETRATVWRAPDLLQFLRKSSGRAWNCTEVE